MPAFSTGQGFSKGRAPQEGDTHRIVGTRGRSVSRPNAPTKPNTGPQGASSDIYELLNPSITQSGRRTDKPVELYPTWNRRGEGRNVIQQGYALTVNTLAGLGWAERQWIAAGQQLEVASGSLNIHYDDVALPFATESASLDYAVPAGILDPGVLFTIYKGRAFWGFVYGGALFAETSINDATPVQVLTSIVNATTDRLLKLQRAVIDGTDCLLVQTTTRMYALSSIDPVAIHASFTYPVTAAGGLIQVPLPKQPMLARVDASFHLLRSDWGAATPAIDSTTRTNLVRTNGHLVDLGVIGGRPPQVLWLESDQTLATTNVYGTEFTRFEGLSISRVNQAGFLRDGLAVSNTRRLLIHDGRQEIDTAIFTNVAPISGYFYFLAGFTVLDDTVIAEVNLVPDALKTATSLSGMASVKRQSWRLDYDRMRWSAISEWMEWTANTSLGASVGLQSTGLLFGHVSAPAYGGSLPYGPLTRRLHTVPFIAQTNTLRKFENSAGTNYFSERGNYALASAGGKPTDLNALPQVRSGGLVLPAPLTYLTKYLDGIETAARDTGGSGGGFYARWGEHGTLDSLTTPTATNPGPQTAWFNQGLKHADRRFPFPGNQSGVLFPQLEAGILRGATTTSTPSIFPMTFHFHVDLEDGPVGAPAAWLGIDRSEG
jgi:hypothetical protein